MRQYKVIAISVYGKREIGSYDTKKEAKEVIRKSMPGIDYHIEEINLKCVCYGRKHQDWQYALRCPMCGSTEKQINYRKRISL